MIWKKKKVTLRAQKQRPLEKQSVFSNRISLLACESHNNFFQIMWNLFLDHVSCVNNWTTCQPNFQRQFYQSSDFDRKAGNLRAAKPPAACTAWGGWKPLPTGMWNKQGHQTISSMVWSLLSLLGFRLRLGGGGRGGHENEIFWSKIGYGITAPDGAHIPSKNFKKINFLTAKRVLAIAFNMRSL